MNSRRRFFLSGLCAAFTATASPLVAQQRQPAQPPVPRPPDSPDPGNQPEQTPNLPAANPKAQLDANQKNLRKDADHLLELAKALKDQVENTEQSSVLSLSLVKKAEEVEKLARQIRDLAKGI
jgi:hypothetical protein